MSPDIEQASAQFMAVAERLPTLWTLTAEWDALLTLVEETPDADQASIEAEIERVTGDIRRKAHGIGVVIRQLEGLAEFQKAESQRLAAKARTNQATADRIKDYAKRCMQAMDIERLETGTFTLAVRVNPPSVNVLDAALVPSEFQRTKIEVSVDKRAILDAFKTDGEIVPGTEIVRTDRLSIS